MYDPTPPSETQQAAPPEPSELPKVKLQASAVLVRLAESCLEDNDDSYQLAAEEMAKLIIGNPKLRAEVFKNDTLEIFCKRWLSRFTWVGKRPRKQIFDTNPLPDRTDRDDGIGLMARGHIEQLFDFPLWGGKRLGDAIKVEVEESATKYYSQAHTMSKIGRWLALVAASMPTGPKSSAQTVEQTLTQSELEAHRSRIERDDA